MESVPLETLVQAKERRDPLQGLVILDGSEGGDTLKSALNKMAGHKILAAPVQLGDNRYAMADIAGIALALASSVENASLPISSVCGLSEKGISIDIENNLKMLVAQLSEGRVHRVLITKDGRPYNLLGQMDVIRHLCSFPETIPEGAKRLSVSDVITQNPLCLPRTENVAAALNKCNADSFSGAAIVDEDGKVLANFSISDLRAAYGQNMAHLLGLTVEQFLKETHKFAKLPVTACAEDSFIDIMQLMNKHHVHRIHIVDADEKPVGVVTTTNIIRALNVL